VPLESADKQLALVDQLRREVIVEGDEELCVVRHLVLPGGQVNSLELVEGIATEIEAIPVDVFVVRSPANGSFFALRAATGSINDPLEDTYVFAVTGPEKLAVWIFARCLFVVAGAEVAVVIPLMSSKSRMQPMLPG
jgi:hypothetical protein